MTSEELEAIREKAQPPLHSEQCVDLAYDDVPRLLDEIERLRADCLRLSARDETDALNDGVEVAAKLLHRIATEGRAAGVFGGEAMEAAAQAILALRAENARLQRDLDAALLVCADNDLGLPGMLAPMKSMVRVAQLQAENAAFREALTKAAKHLDILAKRLESEDIVE